MAVKDQQIDAELARLNTWAGLMELLDKHWPEDIFPTLQDSPFRDSGARIVSLMRWADVREKQNAKLLSALEKIADADYRGNRSREQNIAWTALQEYSE